MIKFNKACVTGNEQKFINEVIESGDISGDGPFTKKCHAWFKENLGLTYNLLTTSCSTSLDMAALLLNIQPGDEVILPSFTFVSTANAFVLRGASLKFVDVRPDTMNLNEKLIEQAITKKTKAIVPVHYAGVACEMDEINALAKQHHFSVVEDAAQGVHSTYRGRQLGALSDVGCYSFHGTKNYTSAGEGGLLILKSEELYNQAEILREKGTNRTQFFRGVVDKYTWVAKGSSYLPSDISAAYLYGQLLNFDKINSRRLEIWNRYQAGLKDLGKSGQLQLPFVPEYCKHNGHMFFIRHQDAKSSSHFIEFAKQKGITTPFHYIPLHSSVAGKKYGEFIGEDRFTTSESAKLSRLPLYYGLSDQEVDQVIETVHHFSKVSGPKL